MAFQPTDKSLRSYRWQNDPIVYIKTNKFNQEKLGG
jgi:hypothetical protein